MRRLILALTLAVAAAMPALSIERLPAERWTRPYTAGPEAVPACHDPAVLATIKGRFANTESSYWNSSLEILDFERVHPIGFRPWGLDFIPRLYCSGVALVSDGRKRRVDYSVIEDGSIIGWSWGVEYCVSGLDRERAYSPDCKMARP